jgi:hypothetical protein
MKTDTASTQRYSSMIGYDVEAASWLDEYPALSACLASWREWEGWPACVSIMISIDGGLDDARRSPTTPSGC